MQYHGLYMTTGLYRQGWCTGDCCEPTHCMVVWAEADLTAREVAEMMAECNPDRYVVGAVPAPEEGTKIPDFLTEWSGDLAMVPFRVFFTEGIGL